MNKGFGIFGFILLNFILTVSYSIFYYQFSSYKILQTKKKKVNCIKSGSFDICIKKTFLNNDKTYDYNKIFKNPDTCINCKIDKLIIDNDKSYLGKTQIIDLYVNSNLTLASSGNLMITNAYVNKTSTILSLSNIIIENLSCINSSKVYLYSKMGTITILKTNCNIHMSDTTQRILDQLEYEPEISNESIYKVTY